MVTSGEASTAWEGAAEAAVGTVGASLRIEQAAASGRTRSKCSHKNRLRIRIDIRDCHHEGPDNNMATITGML